MGVGKGLSPAQLSEANRTGFFRDHFVWETLKKEVIPRVVVSQEPNQHFVEGKEFGQVKLKEPLKALVVGCSSGDEAYSLGIVLSELGLPFHIDAVDIDAKRIKEAKEGVFDGSHLQFVSKERLQKFFEKRGNYHKIKKNIFDIDFFARDVFDFLGKAEKTSDPWANKRGCYSIALCRNVLYYFDGKKSRELVGEIKKALHFNGSIVFGTDDPIPSDNELECTNISEKIFLRKHKPFLHGPYESGAYKEIAVKLAGCGGTGVNVVNRLSSYLEEPRFKEALKGVVPIAIDTNICQIALSNDDLLGICFGRSVALAFGTGGSTKLAEAAFTIGQKELEEFIGLDKTSELYIIAGFGGGTGTVTATRLAEKAKKQGIAVCSIITKPFELELRKLQRLKNFDEYYPKIVENSNLYLLLDLQELLENVKPDTNIQDCFKIADEVIMWTIVAIKENIASLKQYDKKQAKIVIEQEKLLLEIDEKKFEITT